MTEEQIKQNAEEYADVFGRHMVDYYGVKDAYISGAHSRDEEIAELKEEIESLKENEKELFEGFKKRGTKLGELMKENVKLRNPWISVEDRLPELNVRVLILNKNGLISISRRKYDKRRGVDTDWEWVDSWHWANWQKHITHWMPIPELKKGE